MDYNKIIIAVIWTVSLIFPLCKAVSNLKHYCYYRKYGDETEAKITGVSFDFNSKTKYNIYELEYFNGEKNTKARIHSGCGIVPNDPFIKIPLGDKSCRIVCVKGKEGNLAALKDDIEFDNSVFLKEDARFMRDFVIFLLIFLGISAMLLFVMYMTYL